jgi:hypothetical protein
MPQQFTRWHYQFVRVSMSPPRILEHGFVGAATQDEAERILAFARCMWANNPAVRLYLHRRPGLTDVQLAVLPQDGQPAVTQGSFGFV